MRKWWRSSASSPSIGKIGEEEADRQLVNAAKESSRITRDEALELARQACLKSGRVWEDPAQVTETAGEYRVLTNANSLGANLIIRVDAQSGRVLEVATNQR